MDEDGTPLIVNGRVIFNFDIGFENMPTVQELAEQFEEEAWSPKFIEKWHNHLAYAQIGDNPLVTNFPNDVCDLEWVKTESTGGYSRTNLNLDSTKFCDTGTFPVRMIAAFTDNNFIIENGKFSYPLVAVTEQIHNPITNGFVIRTVVFTSSWDDLFGNYQNEGTYAPFSFGFPENFDGSAGQEALTAKFLSKAKMSSGKTIYSPTEVDAAFGRNGIFDSYFDTHVVVGIRQSLPVK